ncbi:MAG: ester cyclase, partial [Alphaproteobacteria bacterium]|nr:ester cyclase [Alphaproteobacteria bacterium]
GLEARYDDEPWGDHRIGRDQVRRFYEELPTAAPDLHIELQHCHAADTAIVVEVMITGTHLGVWRDLPGTGRLLRFPLCGIYTFDGEDRLSGEKIYYDRASVLKQLRLFRETTHSLGRLLTLINHPLTIARAHGCKFLGLKLRLET